jgi:hypothetical protein
LLGAQLEIAELLPLYSKKSTHRTIGGLIAIKGGNCRESTVNNFLDEIKGEIRQ